jgi:hypothetical protein
MPKFVEPELFTATKYSEVSSGDPSLVMEVGTGSEKTNLLTPFEDLECFITACLNLLKKHI